MLWIHVAELLFEDRMSAEKFKHILGNIFKLCFARIEPDKSERKCHYKYHSFKLSLQTLNTSARELHNLNIVHISSAYFTGS